MTRGTHVRLASDPNRTGEVVGTHWHAVDPPTPACDVRWGDGTTTTERATDLVSLDPAWLGGLGDGPFEVKGA